MIKLLRDSQRHHVRHGKHEVWHSFFPEEPPSALDSGFGFLLALDELRLQPGASTEPHWENEAETVTYVYKGAISQEDTAGNSAVMHTGEFQRMSTGLLIWHKETSVTQTESAHVFRLSLRSDQARIARDHVQNRFTEAQRRNLLCVVVSPDGRQGSLPIHQDVIICSAILDPGRHLVYELARGRTAWLQAVHGQATLNDIVLAQGDGIGFTNERSVSLTVRENTEVLLVDLGPTNLRPWEKPSSGSTQRKR